MPGFTYVPFNDLSAVERAITPKTAAILLEPIQAEGGVHVAERGYLQGLRELCRERDVLLIFDEVQTGIGRTGTLFCYEQFGMQPDIMTLAKGLGGGVPIGACLATDSVARAFSPGTHASTFGGNPLACASALAVLRVLLDGKILDQGRRMGEYLAKGLATLKERHRCIKEGPLGRNASWPLPRRLVLSIERDQYFCSAFARTKRGHSPSLPQIHIRLCRAL